MTDPIADMLARIKNALAVKKNTVKVPFSKIKWEILQILHREGFIGNIRKVGRIPKRVIEIELLYDENKKPQITEIKRISKPSRRVYKKASELWPVKAGRGIQVVSTSQGIITQKEARKKGIGGEILIEIW